MDVFSGLARFSGSIELNNKGPTFLTYCPSKNNLDLTMTPEDILHYLCTLQGYSIHEAIFDLKQTLISKLSVDNHRKLSLAICAIGNPNIILLDNITAGLDESSKKTIIEFIQTLKKWNKTVLITSYSRCEPRTTLTVCRRLPSQGMLIPYVDTVAFAVYVNSVQKCTGAGLYTSS
ncbi:hypothetical protein RF11_07111 [Thelohanellus kitauei]|uniref:Uncharacterized protein n=1 Tax=Thelohanellus kitauei TaxID=669202 RepID=A0A0C2MGJ8_THEKT|nr:hypothetical protein RF11_07111 [Thelohanellus kitauei]